jgi:hypothetical protein
MNIIENEIPYFVEAKTSRCKGEDKNVSYRFIESSHSLCVDKGELLLAQIRACKRALEHSKKDEIDNITLRDEITRLRLALDMVQYR